jgi:hypothetical protein
MIRISIHSEESFVDSYLRFFKGVVDLTDTEFILLVRFVILYRKLLVESDYPELELFSVKSKVELRRDLSISSFNNHLKSLRDKGCFLYDRETDSYRLNDLLLPRTELNIKFELGDVSEEEFIE